MVDGAQVVLRRIFYRTVGPKVGLQPPGSFQAELNRNRANRNNESRKPPREPKDRGKKGKKSKDATFDVKGEITLTQINSKYKFVGQGESDEDDDRDSERERAITKRLLSSPLILIQCVRVRTQTLKVITIFFFLILR